MKHIRTSGKRGLFNVLTNSSSAQAAMMTLRPGQSSSDEPENEHLEDELDKDYEALGETAEEWTDNQSKANIAENDRTIIEQEIAELEAFAKLATSIDHNAKGKALIKALDIAFAKTKELGAAQRAIIFTESRRTQVVLRR